MGLEQRSSSQTLTTEPIGAHNGWAPAVGRSKLASRIARLGSETAFAVSAEAAAFAAQGNEMYPFHLGDLNLPTPQNIVEASLKAITDGKTGYCPNAGIAALRAALADDLNASHGTDFSMENVVIQPGGKPVIGKFILTLMNPGDEVLYPNPGYPIYESQIEFHGGVAVPYRLPRGRARLRDRPRGPRGRHHTPDPPARAERPAEPPRRRVLTGRSCSASPRSSCATTSWSCATRPTSTSATRAASASLASLQGMAERSVILYTFSKKFAMTGWRLGAAIGPTKVIEVIAKLNVNDESCPNHFIQYGALEGLTGDQSGPRQILSVLKERRDAAVALLNETPGIRCYTPERHLLPVPQRHRRHGRARASPTSRTSGGACSSTQESRCARGCTSAGRCQARPNSTCVSPIRESTPRAWSKGYAPEGVPR